MEICLQCCSGGPLSFSFVIFVLSTDMTTTPHDFVIHSKSSINYCKFNVGNIILHNPRCKRNNTTPNNDSSLNYNPNNSQLTDTRHTCPLRPLHLVRHLPDPGPLHLRLHLPQQILYQCQRQCQHQRQPRPLPPQPPHLPDLLRLQPPRRLQQLRHPLRQHRRNLQRPPGIGQTHRRLLLPLHRHRHGRDGLLLRRRDDRHGLLLESGIVDFGVRRDQDSSGRHESSLRRRKRRRRNFCLSSHVTRQCHERQ
ncbi:hypothetical protein ACHAXS_006449 [Conticribra weissflogii]